MAAASAAQWPVAKGDADILQVLIVDSDNGVEEILG
jgi:hypothetical protein